MREDRSKGALVVQAGAIRVAVATVSIGMPPVFFGYFLTETSSL
jgi:hypothetical protein